MLRKIRVYGKLAKFLGQRTFEAAVDSAAEAVRFLVVNFPGLERHMADQHYRVSVGTYDLGEDELADPVGQQIIKIVPVLAGAGRGVGKIVAGVALIAGAFFTGGATIGLLGLAAPLAVSTALAGIGISLALSGVSELLTPTPTLSGPGSATATTANEADPRESFNFNGIQNTARAGTPLPIVYGEVITGSVIGSIGVDTARVRG
jgi:predicted phage tail protein